MVQNKKGSASTEVILGKAAKSLKDGILDLTKTCETITSLMSKSEELSIEISNKEVQLQNLEVQHKEMLRQQQVDLELNFKSKEEELVQKSLDLSKRIAVNIEKYTEMEKLIADFNGKLLNEINESTSQLTQRLNSEHINKINLINAENKAKEAQNTAQLTALLDKVKFLEEQNSKLYEQLSGERTASVERAKASAIGSLNIGSK